MTDIETIVIPKRWLRSLSYFQPEIAVKLLVAIYDYAETRKDTEFESIAERIFFEEVKVFIERSEAAYQEKHT